MDAQNRSPVPQVSVLMTVYNTAVYLRQAIESILGQTLINLELIIVDDGSTDESGAIIFEYAAADDRVVALRQANQGLSRSLNRALTMARGELITRQDSDDYSLPGRLAAQVQLLQNQPVVGAVGTAVRLIDTEDHLIRVDSFPLTDAEIQPTLLDRMCFCGPTVMVRRPLFVAAGFYFDQRFSGSDDYDQCLRLAEVTQLANIDTPFYAYRQHPQSMSHQKRYNLMHKKAGALDAALHRRYGADIPAAYCQLLARDYLRTAVLAHASGEKVLAGNALNQAQTIQADLLERVEPLQTILRRYRPKETAGAALHFTDIIFEELLPRSRPLNKLHHQLLAEIHMEEVFAGAHENQPDRIKAHLWLGLRHNPAWIKNKGVWAIGKSLWPK